MDEKSEKIGAKVESEEKKDEVKYDNSKLYEIGPRVSYTAVVIFLHGLGDTGEGWKASFKYFSDQHQYIKFVFPTAPLMSVDIHGGGKSRAWHNITSLKMTEMNKNKFELRDESFEYIKTLIDKETQNEKNPIPLSRIILGGFSQGGAMALYTSLLYPFYFNKLGQSAKSSNQSKNNNDNDNENENENNDNIDNNEQFDERLFHNNHFGGLIMLSGYCPHLNIETKMEQLRKEKNLEISENTKQMPILMGHGNQDLIVDKAFGQMTFEKLKNELNFTKTTFNEYDVPIFMNLGHGVNEPEINAVRKFILQHVPDPHASGFCQLL